MSSNATRLAQDRSQYLESQRSEDPDDIADQSFDFSVKTIKTLFEEGYEDTKKTIENLHKVSN